MVAKPIVSERSCSTSGCAASDVHHLSDSENNGYVDNAMWVLDNGNVVSDGRTEEEVGNLTSPFCPSRFRQVRLPQAARQTC